MKTMPILVAMLVAGSAFALDPVERPSEMIAQRFPRPEVPGGVELARKAAEARTPYVSTQDRQAKADSPAAVLLHPVNPGVLSGGGYTVRDMGPLGVSITKQP